MFFQNIHNEPEQENIPIISRIVFDKGEDIKKSFMMSFL